MTRQDATSDQLDGLLARHFEGQLNQDEHAHLESMLRADGAARRLYRQLMRTHALLYLGLVKIPASEAGLAIETAATATARRQPTESKLSRPAAARRNPWLHPMVLVGLMGTLAAGVLMAVFLTRPAEQSPAAEIVATLVNLSSATWDPQGTPRGAALSAGAALKLVAGTAEVRYRSGAVVILEGPADYVVAATGAVRASAPTDQRADDRNSGRLVAGRLRASVPPPARGFTIHTSLADVVDFGTRFELAVDDAGAKVRVAEGTVRVQSPIEQSTPPAVAPVLLHSGDSVYVDAATGQFTKTSPEAYRQFVLDLKPEIYLTFDAAGQPAPLAGGKAVANLADASSPAELNLGDAPAIAGGAAYSAIAPAGLGRVGAGLQLRGGSSADYLQVHWDLPRKGNFTFAAWVWLDRSASGNPMIAADNWAHRRLGFALGVNDAGQLYALVSEAQKNPRSVPLTLIETAESFPRASWQHVAFVADSASRTLVLYRQGRAVARREGVEVFVPWREVAPPLYLGTSGFNLHEPAQLRCWTGRLDEVAAWGRALAPEDVVQLYQNAPQ